MKDRMGKQVIPNARRVRLLNEEEVPEAIVAVDQNHGRETLVWINQRKMQELEVSHIIDGHPNKDKYSSQ